jgi:eukaryotic-like serine/threonine-protein kinase
MQTATDITASDMLPARLPKGFMLGDYVVDGWLRDGGMASIYRAHRVHDDRRVALKLQLPSTAHDSTIGARFDREAQLMRRVGGSGHVVELFDAGMLDDGRRYLVMEWVDGEDLEELLDFLRNQDQRLQIPRVCRIARDVARGLAALHAHAVVHLDLKPANVMIGRGFDDDDVVKLVDFGIAEDLRMPEIRPLGVARAAVMGTSSYMCPQQADGDAPAPSFDIYALGVMLFELLSGSRVPPDGWTPETLPRLETLRRGVPRALTELVRACMDFEPERRPATAKAVVTALTGIIAGLEPSVRVGGASSDQIMLVRRGGTEVVPRTSVTTSSSDVWTPARTGGTEVTWTHQEVLSSSGIVGPLAAEAVAEAVRRLEEEDERAAGRRRRWKRWGGIAAGVMLGVGMTVWLAEGADVEKETPGSVVAVREVASSLEVPASERDSGKPRGRDTTVATNSAAAPHANAIPDDSPSKASGEPIVGQAAKKSPKRAHVGGPSKTACEDMRATASKAKKHRAWRMVLRETDSRACWSSAEQRVERARLRTTAYAELGELAKCVKEGRNVQDRDVAARTAFCKKKLDSGGKRTRGA